MRDSLRDTLSARCTLALIRCAGNADELVVLAEEFRSVLGWLLPVNFSSACCFDCLEFRYSIVLVSRRLLYWGLVICENCLEGDWNIYAKDSSKYPQISVYLYYI